MAKQTGVNKLNKFLYPFLSGAAVTAAVFCLIISTLLVANWMLLNRIKPTEHPALDALSQRLKADPADESLKEEVRILDLLVRKAYFTRRWQVMTGGYILLGAVVVLVGSLLLLEALRKKIPVPGRGSDPERSGKERFLARWTAGGIMILLATCSLVIAFISGNLEEGIPGAGAEIAAVDNQAGDDPVGPGRQITPYTGQQVEEIMRNWPSFRGPGGTAYTGNLFLPAGGDDFPGLKILWKVPVPRAGFNSPVTWGGRIFISGGDEKLCEVYCYDADTGEMLWQREVVDVTAVPGGLPDITEDTGFAAPTMATDGERVYAVFATGDIVALDFSGSLVWKRNLGKPGINYGHASSLSIYNQGLFVQYDHPEQARLITLDCESGEFIRQAERDVFSSWASPLIAEMHADPVLILNSNPYVSAYRVLTGELLWEVECMNGEVAPSPAYADGLVLAVNDFAALVALDIENGEILWEFYDDLPNVPSPAADEDHVFVATSYGFLTCLDRPTGEVLWLHEFDEGFYSSPVITGDIVWLVNMSGVIWWIRSAAEFSLLGSFDLGEDVVCTPAFTAGRLLIRGDGTLYCLGGGDGGS